MRKTSSKVLGTGLALGLGAGALVAIGAAGPAVAGSGTTAQIRGAAHSIPSENPPWYDSGQIVPFPDTNPGPHRNVTLEAVQNESDVDFTLTISGGPNTTQFAGLTRNKYRLAAYVRINGKKDVRGELFGGPVGTVNVAPDSPTFPGPVVIKGSFKGAGAGTHTVTLNDLVLDQDRPDAGGGFGAPAGVDVLYNPGTTREEILAGKDWAISDTVTLTGVAKGDSKGPNVKVGKIAKKAKKVKAVKGTVKDNDSGPASVSIKAVQKRGKKWFAFDGDAWKKAKTKKKAVKRALLLTDSTVSKGKWKIKVKKVKPGRLIVKYSGTDRLGNVSKTKTKSAKLK